MSPQTITPQRIEFSDLMELVKRGTSFSGRERDCCFLNLQNGKFADISAVSGIDFEDDGRAVGFVDWDFDGDLDFWLANRSGPQVRFARNDLPSGQNYLLLKLEGVTCNRDAIGARVTVALDGDDRAPLMRTVRAGEGFLSQGSRWQHFGLGRHQGIAKVSVRWPGGEVEEFTGVQPNGFYLLKQGAAQALAWQPRRAAAPLIAQELPAEKLEAAEHAALGALLPLPKMEYVTWEAKRQRLPLGGKPLLVVLWASWCEPCAEELKELHAQAKRLEDAGVELLALSSDAIADPKDGPANARDFLERMAPTLPSGLATDNLVDAFQILIDKSLPRALTIGVPQSFLLDRQGRLSAIYRGKLNLDTVHFDVARLDLPDDERRRQPTTLPGRWHDMPFQDILITVAKAYLEERFVTAGTQYVIDHEERLKTAVSYPELVQYVGDRQMQAGNYEVASQWCLKAIALNDKLYTAHHIHGLAQHMLGRPKEAIAAFRQSLKINADYIPSLSSLAWILATAEDEQLRNSTEAVKLAQQVVTTVEEPDPAHTDTLGAAMAAAERYDDAVKAATYGRQLAAQIGDTELIKHFEERYALYRNHGRVIERPRMPPGSKQKPDKP